ncbi:hypothetical protein BC629DRAFT_1292115, partial [Irpex lacteus]
YECVITLCEEMNLIWSRQWTTMTWIYALTRYSTLLLSIIIFFPFETIEVRHLSELPCKAGIYIQYAMNLIQFPCFALFSALRVYALSDGRHIMAGLVFLSNLVPFAVNMVRIPMITKPEHLYAH